MIMDIAALSNHTTRDHFWDWGPSMHYAREFARTTGIRRRVYGMKTSQGWQYHIFVTPLEARKGNQSDE